MTGRKVVIFCERARGDRTLSIVTTDDANFFFLFPLWQQSGGAEITNVGVRGLRNPDRWKYRGRMERERTSSYHFQMFFQTSFFQSLSPIFFLHSPSILTWTKGGKKQRRVIGSGDTRDAYNLDGATGIPPSSYLSSSSKPKKKEPRALSTHAHARATTDTFLGKTFFFLFFPNCHHFLFFFLEKCPPEKK